MSKSRLEAFTDGVMAIIVTILVLEIPSPQGTGFQALWPLRYKLILYLLSFLTVTVYWNNHHHLFQITEVVSGSVLWANNFFLLMISLMPVATAWAGNHIEYVAPEVTMGIVYLVVNISFYILVRSLLSAHDADSVFTAFFGKGNHKSWFSMAMMLLGAVLAFVWPPASAILCFGSLVPWIVPDYRIDRYLMKQSKQ
ncbi:TMEM175 family protein [Secundilactobacillus mixtipabuli]|uniref:Membrane protein n=1 Tax=Secundilactobacillus mixtipabuli TaxID=1435342 RepID=A0A1Z5IEU0_9LACO|nr:TMEM175 family protein [Secundilactobacillus mixtipabuli]GAX00287.1 membrane protein [Secundilactobacillus mixtipabuli]